MQALRRADRGHYESGGSGLKVGDLGGKPRSSGSRVGGTIGKRFHKPMSLISSEDKKMREPKYFIELRPEMKPARSRSERSLGMALFCFFLLALVLIAYYYFGS